MNTGRIGLIALAVLVAGCSSGSIDGYPSEEMTSNGALPGGEAPGGVTPGAPGATPGQPGAGGGVDNPGGVEQPPPGAVPNPAVPGSDSPSSQAATSCEPGIPLTSQIPRLTNAQYERTVYDLLGTPSPGLLATEQAGAITKSVWDGYRASANQLAATVMTSADLRANFMPCTLEGDGVDCLRQTIVEFGTRAYRRPLTDEEVAGYETLITKRNEITANGTADEVAQVILATFLQSPSFLWRAELSETPAPSGAFQLTSYEVASRLSYLLWGSMPDQELFAAAAADELQTQDQVLAQALRMVADPKALDIAREFHREYLHLHANGRWDSARKDTELFPGFTDDVVPTMIGETERLFEQVFTSGGTFEDLFTTNKGYVTAATAALYGLPNPQQYGSELTEVELEGRPGFLTRIGFLAAFANQNRTNPIVRGTFITKDVLGVDPGSPDPNVANTPLPSDPSLDTIRKKVDAMTASPACKGCHHSYINPPGFVMEAFDAAGAIQTEERDTKAPIDTTAEVYFSKTADPVRVEGPEDLMQLIAQSPTAQRRYVAKWVGYAFQRELTGPDQCAVDELAARVASGGYTLQNLLADLSQTDYFLTRATQVTQ